MEKTITIDGKQVNFKSTGAAALRYKNQFGRDFFVDVTKQISLQKLANVNNENFNPDDLDGADFEFFFNAAWVFAKTADKSIPEPMEWLDQFNEFPIMELIPDLMELIERNMVAKKK